MMIGSYYLLSTESKENAYAIGTNYTAIYAVPALQMIMASATANYLDSSQTISTSFHPSLCTALIVACHSCAGKSCASGVAGFSSVPATSFTSTRVTVAPAAFLNMFCCNHFSVLVSFSFILGGFRVEQILLSPSPLTFVLILCALSCSICAHKSQAR